MSEKEMNMLKRIKSDFFRKRVIHLFIIMMGMIVGLILLMPEDIFIHRLANIFKRHLVQIIGAILFIVSIIYYIKLLSLIKTRKFTDVDDKRRLSVDGYSLEKLINKIEYLKQGQTDIDYDKIEALIKKSTESSKKIDAESIKSFGNYFNGIRMTLEEKAAMADEKASILLDKGTAYSKWGIAFYIISIIAWQIVSWIKSFEPQFIYGIVSCTVLFIFIEFLSAWFLKQYRQFVDTSTYLIKVKSIFDKYMLAYLILKESPDTQKENLSEMFGFLKEEIKWPETYLLKNGDISFAKESMEAMTHFAKNMKDVIKENKG